MQQEYMEFQNPLLNLNRFNFPKGLFAYVSSSMILQFHFQCTDLILIAVFIVKPVSTNRVIYFALGKVEMKKTVVEISLFVSLKVLEKSYTG